jgi:hypothetical protein
MIDEIKDSCDVAVEILDDLLLYEKMEGGMSLIESRQEPALKVAYEVGKSINRPTIITRYPEVECLLQLAIIFLNVSILAFLSYNISTVLGILYTWYFDLYDIPPSHQSQSMILIFLPTALILSNHEFDFPAFSFAFIGC